MWTEQCSEQNKIMLFKHRKVIQRCILMTTDPGDLVFDPPVEVELQLTLLNNGEEDGLHVILRELQ